MYEYSAIDRKAVNVAQDAIVLCVRIRGGIVALSSISGSFLSFELDFLPIPTFELKGHETADDQSKPKDTSPYL